MNSKMIVIALAVLAIAGCGQQGSSTSTDTTSTPKTGDSSTSSTSTPPDSSSTSPSSSTDSSSSSGTSSTPPPPTPADNPHNMVKASFSDVQTLFKDKCESCHGADMKAAGIDLSSYESIMKGGKKGPIVVAGDPDKSTLASSLTGAHGTKQMPPGKKLDAADAAKVSAWIKAGAKKD